MRVPPILLSPRPALIPFTSSSKLGEENESIREARKRGIDPKAAPATREATPDDDEGSIVVETGRRGHPSCGACRTRESEAWWKAPKGLASALLCDNCGPSWRKYADLTVRPVRDDPPAQPSQPKAKGSNAAAGTSASAVAGTSAGAVAAAGDKREGTPLTAPAAKRAKVCSLCCIMSACRSGSANLGQTDRIVTSHTTTCASSTAVHRLPSERARGQGTAV